MSNREPTDDELLMMRGRARQFGHVGLAADCTAAMFGLSHERRSAAMKRCTAAWNARHKEVDRG